MSLFDDLLPTKQVRTGLEQTSGKQDDPLDVTMPIIITTSTMMTSTAPEIAKQTEILPDAPDTIPQIIWDNSSILISTDWVSDIGTIASIKIEEDTITKEPAVMSSPLFDINEPIVTEPEKNVSSVFENTYPNSIESITQKETGTEFHDTNTYIDHAIKEVSGLIAAIDEQDAMVLAAEDEHRKQKEYFAELEIADEATHQKHLEERAHAEKMKKYLEKEQGAALKKNEEKDVVAA